MPNLETACPRRDQPYVSSHALTTAARLFAVIDDPAVPAPRSPEPTLPARGQSAFDRIMAACAKTPAPFEAVDVRSTSVQPPPPRKRRRR